MKSKTRTYRKVLKQAVQDVADVTGLNQAAAMIRELPGVLRVQVNREDLRLEVFYKHPMETWLREIHLAQETLPHTLADLMCQRF